LFFCHHGKLIVSTDSFVMPENVVCYSYTPGDLFDHRWHHI